MVWDGMVFIYKKKVTETEKKEQKNSNRVSITITYRVNSVV